MKLMIASALIMIVVLLFIIIYELAELFELVKASKPLLSY